MHEIILIKVIQTQFNSSHNSGHWGTENSTTEPNSFKFDYKI